MSLISITQFSPIQVTLPEATTLADIAVNITTTSRAIDLALSSPPFVSTLDSGRLVIKPNSRWLSGITVDIAVSGVPHRDKYVVPPDPYLYDPEQLLYSSNTLDSTTAETLITSGIGTEEELSLLTAMGPKLTKCWDKFTAILYNKIIYNNATTNPLVIRLVGFRRMQQIAYLLGFDGLVEQVLLSPGPLREWFRYAYIPGSVDDKVTLELLPTLEKDIANALNAMALKKLNTEVINAVDYQVDPNSDYNKLARYILTLFCSIRYNHDNTKFVY